MPPISASDRLDASCARSTWEALIVVLESGDGGSVSSTDTGVDDGNTDSGGSAILAVSGRMPSTFSTSWRPMAAEAEDSQLLVSDTK